MFLFLAGMMFFAGTSGMTWTERMTPRLGLDLVGGTRVMMEAKTLDGGPPPADSLEQARQIIENRVNAIGVEEAEVVTEGDRYIVVSIAGRGEDRLRSVGDAAELRFRKVIHASPGTGVAEPAPTEDEGDGEGEDAEPTPDPSATPGPSADPEATPAPEQETAEDDGGTGGGVLQATPAPEASPTPDSAPDGDEPIGTEEERWATLKELISEEAMEAALDPQLPNRVGQESELTELLKPFGDLDPALVAVLPARAQFYIPSITCEQLDNRPAGSIQDPDGLVVACEGGYKYLLDAATVLGTDVATAQAVIDSQTSRWVVSLEFTGEGQSKWQALTREAVNNSQGTAFDPTKLGDDNRYTGTTPIQCDYSVLGDQGNCLVAVVLGQPRGLRPADLGGDDLPIPDHRQLHRHRGPASSPASCATARCR